MDGHSNDPRRQCMAELDSARQHMRTTAAGKKLTITITPLILHAEFGQWQECATGIHNLGLGLAGVHGSMPPTANDSWLLQAQEHLAEAARICREQIANGHAGLIDLDDAAAVRAASHNAEIRAAVDRVHARQVLRSGGAVPRHMLEAVKHEAIRESEVLS